MFDPFSVLVYGSCQLISDMERSCQFPVKRVRTRSLRFSPPFSSPARFLSWKGRRARRLAYTDQNDTQQRQAIASFPSSGREACDRKLGDMHNLSLQVLDGIRGRLGRLK